MKIIEIFFSIQGESTFSGLPCIFVRVAGCNLRCNYCDTSYAYKEEGEELTVDEIIRRAGCFSSKRVEITGGEPLLQKDTHLLMYRLLEHGYQVLLETNGSMTLEGLDSRVVKIVDIKTISSGFEESFKPENLKFIDQKDQIKFVIGDRKDYEWVKERIKSYSLASRRNLLLSPVYKRLSPSTLADWILKDGLDVRLQIQVHRYMG
ncbi:MAG: radical SAM protein [Thermodesulfobacteriota bacterium]